jgi:translocation and assembly module TamB
MRRLRIGLVSLLVALIILPCAIVLAICIILNTRSGRDWAVREISNLTHASVQITRLSGHFPAYIAARRISLADKNGIYLTINQATLQWHPTALLQRKLSITALTAQNVTLDRLPVSSRPKAKPATSSFSPPVSALTLRHLSIKSLTIAKPVLGHPITLHLTGHANVSGQRRAVIALNATSAGNQGHYQLALTLTGKTIQSSLTATEPSHGLLGQFIGPKLDAGPLTLNATLAGPRQAAALTVNSALGAIHANATGTVNLDSTVPSANITILLPNIAPIAALAGQPCTGSDRLHLIFARKSGGQSAIFDNALSITGGSNALARWMGPTVNLTGTLFFDNNSITIHQITLQTEALRASLQGRVEPTAMVLHGKIDEPNITLIDPQLTGHVTEQIDLTGPRTDFTLNSQVSGVIAAKSLASGPFTITVAATHLPRAPNAKLTGSGTLDGAPLSLSGALNRSSNGAINAALQTLDWKSLSGSGQIALTPGHWPTGSLALTVGHLADIGKLLNIALAGRLHASFAHQSGQPLAMTATLTRAALGSTLGIATATITSQITHPDDRPITTTTATITGLRTPQLTGGMTLSAQGPLTRLALALNGQFSQLLGKPARVSLIGLLTPPQHSLTLHTLSASVRGIDVRLLHPASVQWQPGLSVHHLSLGFGGLGHGGSLTANGSLKPRLSAQLVLAHIPAAIFQAVAPTIKAQGQINATAHLSGTLAAPLGTLALTLDRVHLRTGIAASLPPVAAALKARLRGQSAIGVATLQIGTQSHLRADGSIPFSPQGPIALTLTGAINLALLNALTAASGIHLAGMISPALHIDGTVAAPRPVGAITLTQGVVQDIGLGLDLSSIAATLSATAHQLTLTNLHAKAGNGTIVGTGTIGLAPPMPIDLHMHFNHAQPISSDVLTETIGGKINITGAVRTGTKIGGTLDIDRADINIPSGLPPSVVKLTILRPGQTRPKPSPPPPIALDLTVIAKNQIFIRGDGVFADLGGRLHLGGTIAAPLPSGGLDLLRGHFNLGGKSLSFTKGNISFNGGLLPVLDLEASHSASDGTRSTLALTGTPTAPKITLSSVPYLPSDEVLSHLLYGAGTTHLSAFQAASLAGSLAQLAGVGGGVNPLGGIRNALGLDELSLGSGSGSGAPTLNAGRYVAPGVYVGASQAASGQGSKVRVEINLYKGLKLKSSVSNASGSGTSTGESIGLGYQFNY